MSYLAEESTTQPDRLILTGGGKGAYSSYTSDTWTKRQDVIFQQAVVATLAIEHIPLSSQSGF